MTVLDRRPEPFAGGIIDRAVRATGFCPECGAPKGRYHDGTCMFGGLVGSYRLPDRYWTKRCQPWRPR